MIISFLTEKGGTGKTTLVENLAAHWAREGRDVATWEFDPQGSLAAWHRERSLAEGQGLPAIAHYEGRDVRDVSELKRRKAEIDARGRVVLADTPGSDTTGLRLGMIAADVIVVPLRAGGNDLRSARRMVGLLEDFARDCASRGTRPPLMGMVFNAVRPRSTVHREHRTVLRRLTQGGPVHIFDESVGLYADFERANAMGMGACDYDSSSRATRGVRELADAVTDPITWGLAPHPISA